MTGYKRDILPFFLSVFISASKGAPGPRHEVSLVAALARCRNSLCGRMLCEWRCGVLVDVTVISVQATEAGDLVNGLPNFAKPTTALAPINSAFYSILTGTGEHSPVCHPHLAGATFGSYLQGGPLYMKYHQTTLP